MQTARILQAMTLLMIVAFAASCATTNQYVSKLFNNRMAPVRDTESLTMRFLELDKLDADKQSSVKPDITKDNDSTIGNKAFPIIAESKTTTLPEEPVAKSTNTDGTRTKRTRE